MVESGGHHCFSSNGTRKSGANHKVLLIVRIPGTDRCKGPCLGEKLSNEFFWLPFTISQTP